MRLALLRISATRRLSWLAAPGFGCLAFPAESAARRCAEFISRRSRLRAEAHEIPDHGIWAVRFPSDAADTAKAFWQHSGVGISSRQAAAILEGDGRANAELFRQKYIGGPVDATSARRILYWPATKQVRGEGATSLEFNYVPDDENKK